MSLACYCSRHRSVYLTLKLTKREQWKSLKEVQDRRNIFRNRANLLYCSTRSVSGDGPSSQTPKSEATKEPKDKPKESKDNITKLLQNYKPANEQTEKILKMLKETSNQLREKAMLYYNEKRDYLTKGKMLTEGEEEHWYSARVNFMMKRYENFVGLTDVKNAQVRVQKTEKMFVKSQDDRRETQRLINEVQAKIKNLHTELERTHRGEDKYLELVTLEHTVLREERTYIEQLSLQERNEREAFSNLSRAVRDSHESERAQAEKTKYWAVLGSIIGTSLGVLGTTINNRLRMRELRQIVRDASAGNSQNVATTAAVSTAASNANVSKDLINQNTESLKSEIVEEVQNKFEEYSKKVENVGKSTNDKMNEITKSISKLSDNVGEQKHKSIEVLSLLERRPFTNTKNDVHPESLNKKAVVELQQALETQIMRWEEKVDNIMKLHLENSSNTKSLNALERKVTEVLAFEKYMVEKTAKLYDDYNRNSAIAFEAFQKRVFDIEEKLKDVRSLLLTQSALTEHQTKVMINNAASTAAAKTASSNNLNLNVNSKEAAKLQTERTKEALAALEKSEMVIVNTMELSLKDHEERLNNVLIMNSLFVAVLTPLLVYAINKIL